MREAGADENAGEAGRAPLQLTTSRDPLNCAPAQYRSKMGTACVEGTCLKFRLAMDGEVLNSIAQERVTGLQRPSTVFLILSS